MPPLPSLSSPGRPSMRARSAWAAAALVLLGVAVAGAPVGCDTPPPAEVKPNSTSNISPFAEVEAPPPMACLGTATDCNTYSDPNGCSLQPGCAWTGAFCFVRSCSRFTDEPSCDANACKWTENCSGTPTNCSDTHQESFCNARAGCDWQGTFCSGSPSRCVSLKGDASQCAAQTGCQVTSGCFSGATLECSEFSDTASCLAGPRCGWQVSICAGSALPCNRAGDANTCARLPGCAWELSN